MTMLSTILEPSCATLNELFGHYLAPAFFRRGSSWWTKDNPFRRPLANEAFASIDFDLPLGLEQLTSNASLVANRVLLSIYERDFVMLPRGSVAAIADDMRGYYGERLRVIGELLCKPLERYLFSCVERAVEISGPWDEVAFCAYFEQFRDQLEAEQNARVMAKIVESANPQLAARNYFVQLAGDFLMESSAMTRNVIGNYGALQSELFKVVIDECGYGVHPTKHSKLFEDVLESHGMDPVPHAYWSFYTPGALYLNNYYNVICRDHTHYFRYLGGILQVETSFKVTCKQMADMATAVFGAVAEVRYFREHMHIDGHHSRMVLDNLVRPAIQRYGELALHGILRGFEESLVVADVYSKNLLLQLGWIDALGRDATGGHPGAERVALQLDAGALYGTQTCDRDGVLVVDSGLLRLVAGEGATFELERGRSVAIPAGALFGIEAIEASHARICDTVMQ
jgi:hypothetical protein